MHRLKCRAQRLNHQGGIYDETVEWM